MNDKNVPPPLPIGVSSFDAMIENGYYYVDKTLLIRDLLDKRAMFTLCIRPRRFGKTLNQMMLKSFFEDTRPMGGKDMRSLFNGLKIESAGDKYMEHQGKYPVIYMSFAGVEEDNFKSNCNIFKNLISGEFRRHKYVIENITDEDELKTFKTLCSDDGDIDIYKQSLKFLCKCLEDYHGKKAVILIDEYDVPLQRSWFCGFYDDMIKLIRPLMKDALKDNTHLQFAVMTGCLRVAKESIFTGLNNLAVVSMLSDSYDEYFGFTQAEIDAMLEYYGLMGKRDIVRDWYNGYLFGRTNVYNPWSSVYVVSNWVENINRRPEPHWANTSGNDIVRQLIDKADTGMRTDIETLIAGGVISKIIREDITFADVDKSADNLWTFLFFTGYLKKVGERLDDIHTILDLSIPNLEIKYIYKTHILEWQKEKIEEKDLCVFYRSILCGDTQTFQAELNRLLMESISFMDNAENFYHGYMAGLLQRLDGYAVKSNRESGHGRNDLAMYSESELKVIIFEFKQAAKSDQLAAACRDALTQIDENDYAAEWISDGYAAADIQKYGIGFCKKKCMVMTG